MTEIAAIRSLEHVLVLPSVPYSRRDLLPARPGMYFAVIDDEYVAYIGITVISVRGRWAGHHRKKSLLELGRVRIAFALTDAPDMLAEWERDAIRAFLPRLNVTHMPPEPRAAFVPPGPDVVLVPPQAIVAEWGIPMSTLNHLAKIGDIPAVDVTPPHARHRKYLFDPAAVRATFDENARRRNARR